MAYDPVTDEILVPANHAWAILTFRGDANGDAAPVRKINGAKTQIVSPSAVSIDPMHGEIYVPQDRKVLVFRREADGDVDPVRILQGADTVELKLTVPDADRRSTVVALGMDPMDAFLRQVFFFDTPDLALDRAGIVTRARRTQGKPDDSVVKLRPVDPGDLSDELRGSKLFGVEVDAMPGGFVCSGSFGAAPSLGSSSNRVNSSRAW